MKEEVHEEDQRTEEDSNNEIKNQMNKDTHVSSDEDNDSSQLRYTKT